MNRIGLGSCGLLLAVVLAACGGGSSGTSGGGDGGGGIGGGGGTESPKSDPKPSATEVGVPMGLPATATIDAAGGSLVAPDGRMTLTIPAGVVTTPTEFSIQIVSNFAHGSIGPAYRLAPEGLVFSTPATLTFTYKDADLVGPVDALLGAASQSADGLWHWSSGAVDQAAHAISIPVNHFSDWSMVSYFALSSIPRDVPLPGTHTITGQYCYGSALPSSVTRLVPQVGYNCKLSNDELSKLRPLGTLTNWSVNAGKITSIDASGIIIVEIGIDPAEPPITNVQIDIWDEILGVVKKEVRRPISQVSPSLPALFVGTFSLDTNETADFMGGRRHTGGVPITVLKQDKNNPLRFIGHKVGKVKVDFHLAGLTCDSIAVEPEFDIELSLSDKQASSYLLGAVGTYTAETRCCSSDGICQRQDVSSVVALPICPGDFLRNKSQRSSVFEIENAEDLSCKTPDSTFTGHDTWGFYGHSIWPCGENATRKTPD